MKKTFFSFFLFYFSFLIGFAQQTSKGLDAKFIAANYYRGIVKILLFDSTAQKNGVHDGYVGRGSGFIVTEDGIIFTNRHVVEYCVYGYMDYTYHDAASGNPHTIMAEYSEDKINDETVSKINYTGYATPIVQVYYGKGENEYNLYVAKVLTVGIGSFDGAMLKIISDINGKPIAGKFSALPVGDSDKAVQGEDLCVYGYPAQYDGGFDLMLKDMSTLTFGKLSGYDYVFNRDYGYIKTDASINSGNSGGPVFNESNKVIGIATATGGKTNIGLVGGINGMYYVAAPHSDVLKTLIVKGLNLPKNAGSINTIMGERKPIASAEELNKNKKNSSIVSLTTTGTASGVKGTAGEKPSSYYAKSKVVFTDSKDNVLKKEKYFSETFINKSGGEVYIVVDNYPEPLNCEGLIVDIWKKKGTQYDQFVETKKYTITPTLDYTYFSYTFTEPGEYKISVYTKAETWINTGYLTVKKK